MQGTEEMPLGIIVEKRKLDSKWQEHSWHAVAVLPVPPERETWSLIERGERFERFFAGVLPLELNKRATGSYRDNLEGAQPQVYVVLRAAESGPMPYRPYLATMAPDEAQVHLESGEDLVDGVPIPPAVSQWVKDFVARHHVEEEVYKRKRKPHDPRKGPPPPTHRGPDRAQ